jgi:hypothetical protein
MFMISEGVTGDPDYPRKLQKFALRTRIGYPLDSNAIYVCLSSLKG